MVQYFRLLAVALFVCPLFALADNNELYGLGPRAAAMGGAMSAEANDYSGVFYNPSLLINSKDTDFQLSLQYYKGTATVSKTAGAAELDCSACQPRDSLATSLGFVFPLGGKVKNRLAIGLGLTTATNVLLRVSAPSRSQPYWYRYDSAGDRFVLHMGVGIKITDWLNIGGGFQVLADLVGDGAAVKVDLFSKQVKTGQINSYFQNRFAPVIGVSVTPWRRLRLGATFRGEMRLEYSIPAAVELEGIGALNFSLSGVQHYKPHTVQFGASLDVVDDLTIALDGEWANWSAAPSPYMHVKMNLAGATLAALGLDEAFNLESAQQPPGFADTMTGRLGLEWRISERFLIRAGAVYRPSMVPKQDTPGTNLLDATAVSLTGGIGFNFRDPLDVFENPLKIDASVHGTFLMPRETVKPASDTSPSYNSVANVAGFSVGVRYDY